MITTGVVCRDFIGRRSELDFLVEQVLHPRDQRGAMLLVRGDAGIGKSRLMREFADIITANRVTLAMSDCSEYGDAPYAPLLAIAQTLGATQALSALAAPAADSAAPSSRERSQRYAAFASGLADSVADKTHVAIVENLHWADIATLELLLFASNALKDRRFIFIATLRSEDIGTVGRATSQLRAEIERSADATITLKAMSAAEMRTLLNSALRDDGRRVPTLVLDKIAELSDGRPFHAEELLRGMLDELAGAGDAATIFPRSLAATVYERLASMDPSDRELLAYAAVIGRRFDATFLAELAAKTLRDVLLTLRRARNLQFIVEHAQSNTFIFRHQLTREVVYQEILFAEARALHARIAEILETRAEPDVAAIAYHAWRSGNHELAIRWNEAAGDSALTVSAYTDAIRYYDNAFNAASEPAVRARLAHKVARALYAQGDLEGAADWFATTIGAATAAGDVPAAHRAALDRALALWERGAVSDGIAIALRVTAELADDDSALRFEAETLTASLLNAANRAPEALRHLDIASGLACFPERIWAARHRGIRAHTLARLGRIEKSFAEFEIAIAGAEELGDRELLVRTHNNWADVRLRLGDSDGASRHYTQALEIARDLRSPRLIAWLIANNAYSAIFQGELVKARSLLLEFLQIDHDVEVVSILGRAILYRLGTLLADESLIRHAKIERALERATVLNDRDGLALVAGAVLARRVLEGKEATDFARQMIDQIKGIPDVYWFAESVARGVPSLAAQTRVLILESARSTNAPASHAYLALFDARVASRERRKADAERFASKAAETFHALGWPLEEAYAHEVRGNFKAAIAGFRRCGAVAEVQRLVNVDEKETHRRSDTALTARERQIANLVGRGKSNRDVADELVISERTVETHVAAIFQKLGITNRKELSALLRDAEGAKS